MKLRSGKRIGQSGYELALAVFFSFFLHAAIVIAALFLYMAVAPRVFIPPHYDVKLVGLPAEMTPTPAVTPASPPVPEPLPSPKKPQPKAGKAASKRAAAKAVPKKSALPELSQGKPKPSQPEPPQPSGPATSGQPSSPPAPERPTGKTEGVAVSTPQQDFKYAYYLNTVREKISQNWRPPPDAPDAKARVVFSINRSGWVSEVNLDAEHSNGTFGFKQAAIRAIRSSNPFPPLPEEFVKQTLEFSVDLMAEN